mmetsp:Transcript_11787/g.19642  ORF Transcript_11787/g.19642 Transcript_11787/m.19642 type:complete len:200 (-) Transcript_11787:185-784(-)
MRTRWPAPSPRRLYARVTATMTPPRPTLACLLPWWPLSLPNTKSSTRCAMARRCAWSSIRNANRPSSISHRLLHQALQQAEVPRRPQRRQQHDQRPTPPRRVHCPRQPPNQRRRDHPPLPDPLPHPGHRWPRLRLLLLLWLVALATARSKHCWRNQPPHTRQPSLNTSLNCNKLFKRNLIAPLICAPPPLSSTPTSLHG